MSQEPELEEVKIMEAASVMVYAFLAVCYVIFLGLIAGAVFYVSKWFR